MLFRLTGLTGRLGTAARRNVGTTAGRIPVLDSSARLPAVDGSQLTNVISTAVIRSYLAGLALSTAGSSGTFGIAAGVATDSTNAAMMSLASAYTKTTSAWALGTAAGGLDTGAIANSTWYHVFLIRRSGTGVVDVLFSLSASAPTMPTNYDQKRRIGSIRTNGAAQWVGFTQIGDLFLWNASVNDVNVSNLSTVLTSYTLTVPTGLKVIARIRGYAYRSAASPTGILIGSPDENSAAIYAVGGQETATSVANNVEAPFQIDVSTNTSGQVTAIATAASTNLQIATYGWFDRRQRDD